jgi:DNA helicase-2/ATP-dependent DNA helicase PcrA
MAKGLEFHTVHIAGCDECIFPLIRAGGLMLDSAEERKKQTEEERRLFYVGCTRAKKQLYLYHAARRFWQGSIQNFPLPGFWKNWICDRFSGRKWGFILDDVAPVQNRGFESVRRFSSFAPREFTHKSNSRHIVYKNAKKEPKPEPQGPRIVYDEYSENPFHPGVKVRHGRFGVGVLLSCSGSGEEARVEVRFGDGTVRKLVLKFASLDIVG